VPSKSVSCVVDSCENPVTRPGLRCARCANERRLALQNRRRHNQQGKKTLYPAGDLPAPDAAYVLDRIEQVQRDLDRFEILRLRARAAGQSEVQAEDIDDLLRHIRVKLALAVQSAARWQTLNKELGEPE